jgi:hypothetical protein
MPEIDGKERIYEGSRSGSEVDNQEDNESGSDSEGDEDDVDDENEANIQQTDDVEDDFALLALAKKRLAAQEAHDSSVRETSEKSEADVVIETEVDNNEDDDSVSTSGSTEEENEEENDASPVILQEEKKDDHVSFAAEPQRRHRDENAELWALLQQSKNRIQSTKHVIIEESDADEEEDDDDDEKEEDSSGAHTNPDEIKPEKTKKNAVDDSREEERKRKFETENQELWDLLQKSKNRLEEAARTKMKNSSKEALQDDAALPIIPAARIENPYKDIDSMPDEANDANELTQKELLLAMAVAEEAARSGKEVFETPSREELRLRDIKSFDFLKDAFVPETPIGDDAKEEERERNRFALLTQALSNKWAAFRAQLGDLDISQRLPRASRK